MKTKKILSFILVASFFMSCFPFSMVKVYADMQNQITDFDITDKTTSTSGSYSLDLSWKMPAKGGKDSSSNLADNGEYYNYDPSMDSTGTYQINYDIQWRNASKREDFNTTNRVQEFNIKGEQGNTTHSFATTGDYENGSIYSFIVKPWHEHLYNDDEGGTYTANAPTDSGVIRESLYLTDIQLSDVSATPNSITVTWDNPSFDGKNVFDGYRLYYSVGGASAVLNGNYTDVVIDNPDLDFNRTLGTVSYTFPTDNLVIGTTYAIKIEPLVKEVEIRDQEKPKVTIDGEKYDISFPSKSIREYRDNSAYVKPSLYVKEESASTIRLFWDSLASSGNISTIKMYSSPLGEESSYGLIGVLGGDTAKYTNFLILDKPNMLTAYKMEIIYEDGSSIFSNEVFYDPTNDSFEPYKPIILDANAFEGIGLNVTWEAFLRKPINDIEIEEAIYDDKFLDENLSYTLWISDNLSYLNDGIFDDYSIITDSHASNYSPPSEFTFADGKRTLAYSAKVNTYTSMVDGMPKYLALEDNKIYYLKMQAERDGTHEDSTFQFYSIFIPPMGDLIVTPVNMHNPPFRIRSDKSGDYITTSSIGVEWDELWYEAYDEETKNWYSIIGKNKDGKLVFGDEAKNITSSGKTLYLYDDKYKLNSLALTKQLIATELGIDTGSLPPIREQSIIDGNYEIFTANYEFVDENGGYLNYYSLIENEKWTSISPETSSEYDDFYYTVTKEDAPNSGELTSNTPYLIYLRTFIINNRGEKVYSLYPAFVVASTLKDRGDLDIIPTATQLEDVSATDTSLTIRWIYTEGLSYDLKISDLIGDYPDGGIDIPNDTILETNTLVSEDGNLYCYYTIENLFPDTEYNMWLKTFTPKNESNWSSPLEMRTNELAKPDKPYGLSIASQYIIDTINTEFSVDFVSTSENYMILEWLRVTADTNDIVVGINTDGAGSNNEYIGTSTLPEGYAAKFNDLVGNTKYFTRVKTIHTVTKEGINIGQSLYSYIIEISENQFFVDAISMEVPFQEEPTGTFITMESDWSDFVYMYTGNDDNEYDGNFDPDLYPLPEDDFEIIVSGDEITYVFRGDEFDSQGKPNFNVDQRFISKMIDNEIYDFAIDLTRYDGRYYKNRHVKIPYTIVNGFSKHGATLTIKANNIFAKFDMNSFLNYALNNNLSDFGEDSYVMINITEKGYPIILNQNEYYASKPQQIGAQIVTPTKTVTVKDFSRGIDIDMLISNRYTAKEDHLSGHKLSNNSTSWVNLKDDYNILTNRMSFTTNNSGAFSVIGKAVGQVKDYWNSDDYYTVNTYINITDLYNYDDQKDISASQFNKIVYAIGTNKDTVAMNDILTNDEMKSLGRSNLLVSGAYINKEDGISSLVRLYEVKNGNYADRTPLAQSGFSDYNSVSDEHKISMEKAIHLGFLDRSNSISPKSNMTFGDFMNCLSIILDDM